MSEAAAPRTRPRAWGCLWRVGLAFIVLIAIGVGLTFAFNQGAKEPQPPVTYDAGTAEGFDRGTVNEFAEAHMFITRLQDGSFIALYNKSAKQQELSGDCRVHFNPTTPTGSAQQLPGFTGGFVEDCDASARTVWLADGTFAFGASYPGVPLDRFDTHIDSEGELIVDLGSRSCTKSRGAPGLPPFDPQRCGQGN
jgi:hypothetical protein